MNHSSYSYFIQCILTLLHLHFLFSLSHSLLRLNPTPLPFHVYLPITHSHNTPPQSPHLYHSLISHSTSLPYSHTPLQSTPLSLNPWPTNNSCSLPARLPAHCPSSSSTTSLVRSRPSPSLPATTIQQLGAPTPTPRPTGRPAPRPTPATTSPLVRRTRCSCR